MLIQCKNCNVSFDDQFGKCIACGSKIRLSPEEEFQQCIVLAKQWLGQRKKTKDIFSELAFHTPLPSEKIREAIQTAKEQRRIASRNHGLQIAGTGLLLMLASLGLWIISFGIKLELKLLAVGAVFFIAGLLKVLTGWNITGHDED